MTDFTMPLKKVIEQIYNPSIDPYEWEQSYASFTFNGSTYAKLPVLPDPVKIGLGTYPIFNEQYRPILNGKIVDEYFNREIGMETIDLFQLAIRRKMDQIMPYYNELYESKLIEFDPLSTMDIRSVGSSTMATHETSSSDVNSDSDTTGGGRVVNSNTPQTMLRPNADYATSATDSNSTSAVVGSSTSDNESNGDTESNSDSHVTGYQMAASDLIMKFRSAIINIDTMILADVEDCFMLVMSTADNFTNNERWYF